LKGTGRQKAVLVAPGFGMAADCFYVGSPSLVEYLCRRRYDVYLLDYRGSDHLTISLTQFTLDELVDDFKSAFARVHQQAGAPIRVIGHCVASLVTTMTLLKHEHAGIVQSAILSQTHVFQNHPLINRVKAWTRLPQLLMVLGFNPVMTSDHDVRSGHGSRLLDVLLRFYPTAEHCSSPVCRRTLLMYGEVLRHHQFDRQTHDMLYDLFDRSNLTLLSHMALLVRRGHAVDKHGHEVYLTENNGKRLTMPITILQGRLNNLFRPVAAQRTLAWMREFGPGNPAGNQRRFRMLPIDHYAHLDHFLGRHAADDVFGKLVQAMDDMDRM
jgi:pimeloyl-ACP methyl ester carboxylesterase